MQQTNLKNRFIRLVKVISRSGYCSRREAEGLITSGKVLLNGNPYKEFLIQPEEIKKLSINGKKLSIQKTRLWCFNKSTGLICSNSNQYEKKTIFEILPSLLPRVVTVGRLDINSEGLLLLTNNPSLSSFLEHPRNSFIRIYNVTVKGEINQINFGELEKGIVIDGIKYNKVKIKILNNESKVKILRITLVEGKNREIRKILKYYGLKVIKLKRIQYGPFKIKSIEKNKVEEIENCNLIKILENIGFKNEDNFW